MVNAEEVPVSQAKNIAVNFISQFNGDMVSISDIQSVIEYNYSGQKVFYIINFSNNIGYTIISSESSAFPVLGFVPNQIFDTISNKPQAFQNLMTDYSKQILDIRQRNLATTKSIKQRWENLNLGLSSKGSLPIGPLLTTIWSQGCYFNDSTPTDPGGPCMNVVTGCVATAMGQVINYHNFPPQGSGSHSYQSSYGKLSANFGVTNYNWQLMADTLNSSTPDSMVAAVAQLLSHCGISVDMMYSGGSSGAYSEDALKAIIHYFNFSDKTEMLYRDNYTDSIWEQMVINELDSLRPLYYDGSGTGGHAFICDGYQGNHYFHFNWGWNGSNNGWFLLTNLNPGGMNFGMYNAAFFGMEPQFPSVCQGVTDTLTGPYGNFSDGSSYQNYGDNVNCAWLIQPQGATSITLDFYTFSLAVGDTVFVYDGSNANAPLLKAIYGDSLPASIASSSGTLFVEFLSDNAINHEGWSASYKSEFCQGNVVLTADAGQISDGSGNFLYNNNTNCSWLISPVNPDPIYLFFDNFHTETGFDYLKIYDGADANGVLLGSFDGQNLPSSIVAQSGQMYIQFTSDGGVVDEGWDAHYIVCAPLALPISSNGNNFCSGDSILLKANILADSLTWQFNGQTFSNDSSVWISDGGSYRYIAKRQGCGVDTSQAIIITKFQSPSFYLGSDTFYCFHHLSGLDPLFPFNNLAYGNFSSYQWNTGDTTKYIRLLDFINTLTQIDSNYTLSLIVTDSNDCKGYDTVNLYVMVCEGIDDVNKFNLAIFPNPISNELFWNSNYNEDIILRILSIDSKVVLDEKVKGGNGRLDCSKLPSGIYQLQVIIEDKLMTKKLIKL